jgi:hypothetical protein
MLCSFCLQMEHRKRQLGRQMSGAELAAAAAQEAAEAVRNDWTDEDEKAYWDEWKRINGEPLWWW